MEDMSKKNCFLNRKGHPLFGNISLRGQEMFSVFETMAPRIPPFHHHVFFQKMQFLRAEWTLRQTRLPVFITIIDGWINESPIFKLFNKSNPPCVQHGWLLNHDLFTIFDGHASSSLVSAIGRAPATTCRTSGRRKAPTCAGIRWLGTTSRCPNGPSASVEHQFTPPLDYS